MLFDPSVPLLLNIISEFMLSQRIFFSLKNLMGKKGISKILDGYLFCRIDVA